MEAFVEGVGLNGAGAGEVEPSKPASWPPEMGLCEARGLRLLPTALAEKPCESELVSSLANTFCLLQGALAGDMKSHPGGVPGDA